MARVVTDPTPTAGGPAPVAPPQLVKPPRSTGVTVAIVLGSVFAGFVALAFLAMVAVTFLGTAAEPELTEVPLDDPAATAVEPTTAEADPTSFCPTPREVAAATGSTVGAMTMTDAPFELDGVSLPGHGCRFDDGTLVLALDQVGRERAAELFPDPTADVPSVDLYMPADANTEGEDMVATVFRVDDETYAVVTPGTDRPELLRLVAAVRALVE